MVSKGDNYSFIGKTGLRPFFGQWLRFRRQKARLLPAAPKPGAGLTMSPAWVYGYHTRLFSQSAPKLSVVAQRPPLDFMASHIKWASIQRRRATRARGREKEPVHAVGGAFRPERYEGYGPGGAAVVVDSVTDDRRRTGSAVRETFTRYGGHPGAQGSVSYLFHTVGLMTFPPGTDEAKLMQVALEAGAEDVVLNDDTSIEVLADPVEFETVRAILTDSGFGPATAEVTERASIPTPLAGEAAELMVKLLEALEDLDDVRDVYSNVEISDEVLARI
jgi:transcriptional/translational regulatory protein YebC/TACO1